jgi:hypothetical protein
MLTIIKAYWCEILISISLVLIGLPLICGFLFLFFSIIMSAITKELTFKNINVKSKNIAISLLLVEVISTWFWGVGLMGAISKWLI